MIISRRDFIKVVPTVCMPITEANKCVSGLHCSPNYTEEMMAHASILMALYHEELHEIYNTISKKNYETTS